VARYNTGRLLRQTGEPLRAVEQLTAALALEPHAPHLQLELGMCFKALGRYAMAETHLREAARLSPHDPVIPNVLGNTSLLQGELQQAVAWLEQAILLRPDYAEAWNNIGSALLARGEVDAALAHYRQAIAIRPAWSGATSNVLLAENYLCEDPEALCDAHRRQGKMLQTLATPFSRTMHSRHTSRKLRLGFVSPDFRAHSVAWFLQAPFEHFDRSAFDIVCFSDVTCPDTVTKHLRSRVTEWHNIQNLTDDDVCRLIDHHRINILFDLAGHTAGNRLGVFARQPAPVQTSWLGYPNTTGLQAIHYRLTDTRADPPGAADTCHTETLVRLPDGFLCYTPGPDCPTVTEPPCLENGYITFGSFNVLAKLSNHCLQVWCTILQHLPGTRLILKSAGLNDASSRALLLRRFGSYGIDPDRIDLLPRTTSYRTHMECYRSIDVALDTFPYNGTTTTCEALWMGVPVITVAGNRHAGRVGTSLLWQAGLQRLVARDDAHFARLAEEMTASIDELVILRRMLRGQLAAGPMCDGARFTRQLETACREMAAHAPVDGTIKPR
jgi:predicted O-linked N-acetylglucosamine transferase (SPINDLY family)